MAMARSIDLRGSSLSRRRTDAMSARLTDTSGRDTEAAARDTAKRALKESVHRDSISQRFVALLGNKRSWDHVEKAPTATRWWLLRSNVTRGLDDPVRSDSRGLMDKG